MSALTMQLFGHMRITLQGESAPIKAQRAVRSLLAYLVLQPRYLYSRDQLIGAFWSEQDERSAHNCLTTALWRLRQILEPVGAARGSYLVITDAGEIGFNWNSNYWLDIEHFETAIEPILQMPVQEMHANHATLLEKNLTLYQGDLLEDFYEDWVIHTRERFRRLHLNSLAHLMHYYSHHQKYARGLTCGQQILELDPLREEIHRQMMRLYVDSGQRTKAIHQYESCRQILAAELGIVPMDETEVLYHQIVADCTADSRCPACQPNAQAYRQALAELQSAMRRVEAAHDQIARAMQLMKALAPEGDAHP